jgi:hypothetical protein
VQAAVDAGASFDRPLAVVEADVAAGNPLSFLWGLIELGMVTPLFPGGARDLLLFVKSEN